MQTKGDRTPPYLPLLWGLVRKFEARCARSMYGAASLQIFAALPVSSCPRLDPAAASPSRGKFHSRKCSPEGAANLLLAWNSTTQCMVHTRRSSVCCVAEHSPARPWEGGSALLRLATPVGAPRHKPYVTQSEALKRPNPIS